MIGRETYCCIPSFGSCVREDHGGKSAAKAARSTIFATVTGKYYNTHANEEKLHRTAYSADVQYCIVASIEGRQSNNQTLQNTPPCWVVSL